MWPMVQKFAPFSLRPLPPYQYHHPSLVLVISKEAAVRVVYLLQVGQPPPRHQLTLMNASHTRLSNHFASCAMYLPIYSVSVLYWGRETGGILVPPLVRGLHSISRATFLGDGIYSIGGWFGVDLGRHRELALRYPASPWGHIYAGAWVTGFYIGTGGAVPPFPPYTASLYHIPDVPS